MVCSSLVIIRYAHYNSIFVYHQGYYGSFINMAANSGIILGNLVGGLLRQLLTDEQLLSWGWRVAFISGIAILPCAIYLRVFGQEHNPNEGQYNSTVSNEGLDERINVEDGEGIVGSISASQQTHPLRESVKRENWPALASSTLVPMLYGGGYYLSVVWMAIYMDTLLSPPISGAFWVNLACNIVGLTMVSFLAGWLSDRVGRVKLMTFGAISVGIIAPVMVWIISWGKTAVEALFAQMAICVFLSFYCKCKFCCFSFSSYVDLPSLFLFNRRSFLYLAC